MPFLRQQRRSAGGPAEPAAWPISSRRAEPACRTGWAPSWSPPAWARASLADRVEADGDDYRAILVKALADRLAEAFAECLHRQVRARATGATPRTRTWTTTALIREEYRGIRPAPGLPGLPGPPGQAAASSRCWTPDEHTGVDSDRELRHGAGRLGGRLVLQPSGGPLLRRGPHRTATRWPTTPPARASAVDEADALAGARTWPDDTSRTRKRVTHARHRAPRPRRATRCSASRSSRRARGKTVRDIIDIVEQIAPLKPPFIDVTSHSGRGHLRGAARTAPSSAACARSGRARISICGIIQNRYGIDTVPHLLCTGFTREETEDAVIELNYLGIHNVLAIRGDESNYAQGPRARAARGTCYASDLVSQLRRPARGQLPRRHRQQRAHRHLHRRGRLSREAHRGAQPQDRHRAT